MGRRIRWLGMVMMLCFALVLLQLANIQLRRAPALNRQAANPRNYSRHLDNQRGDILAADGTVLAQSVPSHAGKGKYQYARTYPTGSLFSQIVGYDSIDYGTNGVEYQYNSYLELHAQPVRTLSQFFKPPAPTPDNVILTLEPALQQAVVAALGNINGVNKDGAVVVLDPHTGAVLAMYSSPSYDPSGFGELDGAAQNLARVGYLQPDGEGFAPDAPIATQQRFPPGSTSKVVTSAAAYDLKPKLDNFFIPVTECLRLPQSDKALCNDSGPCGGPMTTMLPASCDPGYADLGLLIGGSKLAQQAAMFGYNTVPPLDLPYVIPSAYPTAQDFENSSSNAADNVGLPGVAYSSIGQQNVDTTALQDALIAAGIANGGVVMVPHVMSQVRDGQGKVVDSFQPTVWHQATTQATAAAITTLMESVVTAPGATAAGCINPDLDAAVKTGTAQTGGTNDATNTDDWMIGFAPANNPKVAVAVVAPFEAKSATGAKVAGPIMNAVLGAALGVSAPSGSACP